MTAHAPLTVCVGVAAADVFAGSSSTVRRALLAAPRRRLGRPAPRRGAPGCSWAALGGPGRRGAAHGRLLGGPGRLRGETARGRPEAGPMALRRYLECSSHPSNPPKPPVRTPVHPAIHPPHPPAIYHPRVDAHVSAHELQPLRHQEPDPVAAGRRARRGHAHRSHRPVVRPVARCRGQGDLTTAGLARRRPRRVERRAAHRQGDRSRRVTGEEGGARGAREPPRSLSRVPRSSGSLGHRSLVCSFVFINLRG